ncbi:MAG: GEVED domain-containing protein, partial [Crocinitomicaceae bacterium]|nr:GEVED domain-containing protein [Crocinitomicaceae bacterium]
MKKNIYVFLIALPFVILFSAFDAYGQACCSSESYGQFPASTYSCLNTDGTVETITTTGRGGEYSRVDVINGYEYSFQTTKLNLNNGNVNAKHVSITNADGSSCLADRQQTGEAGWLVWTATYTGELRFYSHKKSNCASDAGTSYTRKIKCQAPPVITSFTPSAVCQGASVTITGTNLASATAVTVGGVSVTVTSNTATEIIATIGVGPSGDVSVTNSFGTGVSSNELTVKEQPQGLSVSSNGVTNVCSGGSVALSSSVTIPSIPSSYSDSYATSNLDTYISNVTLNSVSTNSGINIANEVTDNLASVITITPGGSYTLSITTSDDDLSATYDHGIAAYIDWNADGDFADADENVYTTVSEVDITTISTTVNVPSTLTSGDIMLRVVVNEASASPQSTGTYQYGETEEYTLRYSPDYTYDWESSPAGFTSELQDVTSNAISQTTTYTVTAALNGCEASASTSAISAVAAPEVSSAASSTSDVAVCGLDTYAVNLSNSTSGTWSASPANAALFVPSQGSQNISVSPTGVNQNVTFTWTENTGVCSGITDQIIISFNQPVDIDNAVISIAGADSDTYLWGGLSDADWSTGSNWYKWNGILWIKQNAAPNSSEAKIYIQPADNLCITATAPSAVSGSVNTIDVANGASLDLSASVIAISGNVNNAGSISPSTSTIEFNGTSDQTIAGGGSTVFNNLTVNKSSSALVMNSPVTVSGALTMTEGNINNGSNILTIGESSAIPGAITHSSGSVTGKLRRYFADASSSSKSFPIGSASKTRDVTVNFAASPGSNQFLTASYNAGYPQLSGADLYAGLPLTTSDGQLIQNYDDEGYWEISPGSSATGTGDSYSADINSEDYTLSIHMNGLTGDNAASMDRSKVRIIKSAGPSHTSWVALTHNAATCIGGVDADNN